MNEPNMTVRKITLAPNIYLRSISILARRRVSARNVMPGGLFFAIFLGMTLLVKNYYKIYKVTIMYIGKRVMRKNGIEMVDHLTCSWNSWHILISLDKYSAHTGCIELSS